jgi:ActR/RegA family two-component response regulator/chemotaxis protein CheY-P-specific phosphatase CheC
MDKQVLLNKTLTATIHKLEKEIGGLLGQEFTCTKPTHSFMSRDDLFSDMPGKAVLSLFEVSGDKTGNTYVVVDLKDAITLGGTLILLPPDEMDSRRKNDLFDGEVCDAFGEIANFIAGAYTSVFIEYANPKLHFKKSELTPFAPDSPSAPVPAGVYYVTTSPISTGGKALGTLSVLFPPELLGLEPPIEETKTAATKQSPQPDQPATATAPTLDPPPSPAPVAEQSKAPTPPTTTDTTEASHSQSATATDPALILVVSETQQAAESFAQNFSEQCNCDITCMHFQGDFQMTARDKNIRGVFLTMREVGDRGLASIIKIQSAVGESTPLIAAGPAWTRKTVLQAIKYGASDILVTPASKKELLDKIHQHMQILSN